ncbi:MAG: putative addiction module antidote protein [Bdellovibrionaceae bacterium]|nr:putative addiction module antidote protein [Pseudobdellovibrionaceae bacterium]MBX3033465.1 putative addiction module antidote protein [Pseudobdellovibrionaceae bacterium]
MTKYEDGLSKRLRDPRYAVTYLNAVLEDPGPRHQERFLMALRDVAKAHGFGRLAENSIVSREALYRILSKKGNPELTTLFSLLGALGLKIQIKAS